MKNWRQTILSQYWDSPILTYLLGLIDEWISPDADLEAFYNLVWDIEKDNFGARGYGLDVWGRIVVVNRVVHIPSGCFFGFGEPGDRTGFSLINIPVYRGDASFGFAEARIEVGPFGTQFVDLGPYLVRGMTEVTEYQQCTFYTGVVEEQAFTLPDEYYRLLIFAKAAYNITDGSIPAINAIMMGLFPRRGNAYVIDGGEISAQIMFGFGEADDRQPFDHGPFGDFLEETYVIPIMFGEAMDRAVYDHGPWFDYIVPNLPVSTGMTMTFAFDFDLEPSEIAVVTQANVLPRPSGVKANYRYRVNGNEVLFTHA